MLLARQLFQQDVMPFGQQLNLGITLLCQQFQNLFFAVHSKYSVQPA